MPTIISENLTLMAIIAALTGLVAVGTPIVNLYSTQSDTRARLSGVEAAVQDIAYRQAREIERRNNELRAREERVKAQFDRLYRMQSEADKRTLELLQSMDRRTQRFSEILTNKMKLIN